MPIREQAILELIAQFQGAHQEIAQLQERWRSTMSRMDRETDEVELRRLEVEARELAGQMSRVGREGREALGELVRRGDLAENELRDITRRAVQLDDALEEVNRETDKLSIRGQQGLGGLGTAVGRLRTAFASLGTVLAAVGVARIAQEAVETAAKFQQLRVQLKTVEGDAEAAEAAFERILSFATKTPFEVENITEAWIRLRAVGLRPSVELLGDLGEIAAANGRDILSVAEAVVGAVTGETERLKQFGIVARQEGERITFNFKGVKTEIDREAGAIVEFLRNIGRTEFAGGMVEQSRTLTGAVSNLQDVIAQLADRVGREGLTQHLTEATKALTTFIEEHTDAVALLTGPWLSSIQGAVFALQVLDGVLKALQNPGETIYRSLLEIAGSADPLAEKFRNVAEELEHVAEVASRGDVAYATQLLIALMNDLQAEGKLSGEALTLMIQGVDDLIAAFQRERGEVPGILEEVRDRLREKAEATRDAAAEAEEYAAQLERLRQKEEDARKELIGSREELEALTRVRVGAILQIIQEGVTTEEQAEAIKTAVQELLDAWAKLGEEAPVSLQMVAQALGVTTTAAQKAAEEAEKAAKKAAEEEEKAADRRVQAAERVVSAFARAQEQLQRLQQQRSESPLGRDLEELQKRREELQAKPLLSQEEVGELERLEEQIREVSSALQDAAADQDAFGERSRESAKVVDDAIRSVVGSIGPLFSELGSTYQAEVQRILQNLQGLGQSGLATADDIAAALGDLQLVFQAAGQDSDVFRSAIEELRTGSFDVVGALKRVAEAGEEAKEGFAGQAEEAKRATEEVKKAVVELEVHTKKVKELVDTIESEIGGRGMPVMDAFVSRFEDALELCDALKQCIAGATGGGF